MVLTLWLHVFDYGCVALFDMERYGFHCVLTVDSKWKVRGIKRGECVINSVTYFLES